jgi:hypothetical protein
MGGTDIAISILLPENSKFLKNTGSPQESFFLRIRLLSSEGACRNMRPRAKRGQVFIIIVIIILIIVALFVLLPMFEAGRRSGPLVQQVFWQANGQNVTKAYLGGEVELHAVVRAVEEYTGSVVIRIRKDIAYWFDSDYVLKTFPLDLTGGRTAELNLTFSPDEASQGRTRGYFVEMGFTVTGTNWVMDDSYPPRLEVITYPPSQGTPV